MKTPKPNEATIKRSAAAAMLGVTSRTIRRKELNGKLTPIKRNCRSTFYYVSEVEKLRRGDIPTNTAATNTVRVQSGEFSSAEAQPA